MTICVGMTLNPKPNKQKIQSNTSRPTKSLIQRGQRNTNKKEINKSNLIGNALSLNHGP